MEEGKRRTVRLKRPIRNEEIDVTSSSKRRCRREEEQATPLDPNIEAHILQGAAAEAHARWKAQSAYAEEVAAKAIAAEALWRSLREEAITAGQLAEQAKAAKETAVQKLEFWNMSRFKKQLPKQQAIAKKTSAKLTSPDAIAVNSSAKNQQTAEASLGEKKAAIAAALKAKYHKVAAQQESIEEVKLPDFVTSNPALAVSNNYNTVTTMWNPPPSVRLKTPPAYTPKEESWEWHNYPQLGND